MENMRKTIKVKFILFLLLIFSTASCAEFSFTKNYKDIDEEMKPYVDEFIFMSQGKVTQKDIKGLTTGFFEPPSNSATIGVCNYLTYEISIKESFWKSAGHMDRMEVMFHELGHCVKRRQHTGIKDDFWHDLLFELGLFKVQDSLRDGCPSSIMHPYILGWYCFNKHYNYYIDELFLRTNKAEYDVKPWDHGWKFQN